MANKTSSSHGHPPAESDPLAESGQHALPDNTKLINPEMPDERDFNPEGEVLGFCSQVADRLIEIAGDKQVELIVPVSGALPLTYLALRELRSRELSDEQIGNISIRFVHLHEDEDGAEKEVFSKSFPVTGTEKLSSDDEQQVAVIIDDIFDEGNTGRRLRTALEANSLFIEEMYLCRKRASEKPDGVNIINWERMPVFPDEWLLGWGGMNSNEAYQWWQASDKTDANSTYARIDALERLMNYPLAKLDPTSGLGDPERYEAFLLGNTMPAFQDHRQELIGLLGEIWQQKNASSRQVEENGGETPERIAARIIEIC
jgi:hypothetical protein